MNRYRFSGLRNQNPRTTMNRITKLCIGLAMLGVLLTGCITRRTVVYRDVHHVHHVSVAEVAPSPELAADLKARLRAADSIISFTQRDRALAPIARDAARAGETALAKQALAKMTSFTSRDRAASEAARELAKTGHRTDAIDIARTITSFTQRDAALKELAQ